jgi:hypothetical protein
VAEQGDLTTRWPERLSRVKRSQPRSYLTGLTGRPAPGEAVRARRTWSGGPVQGRSKRQLQYHEQRAAGLAAFRARWVAGHRASDRLLTPQPVLPVAPRAGQPVRRRPRGCGDGRAAPTDHRAGNDAALAGRANDPG